MIALTLDAGEEGFRNPGLPAVSPDGSTVAFPATDASGKRGVWVRPLSAPKGKLLAGTDGAVHVFWSPDGRYLGLIDGDKLRRIPASGGAAQIICDSSIGRGGSWNANGDIILQPDSRLPIFRVPASGGKPVAVTRLEPSRFENSHRYPRFLPDGRRFLFTSRATPEHTGIYAASLHSPEAKRILAVPSTGAFAPSGSGEGHLLFVREGTLYAQPMNERSLELEGDPVAIAGGVRFTATGSNASFDVSADGRTLAYVAGESVTSQLTWFDRSGKGLGELGPTAAMLGLRISPDDERAVFSMPDPFSGNRDLWLIEFSKPVPQRLTLDPNNDWQPVWSQDGRHILFNSDRLGGVGRPFVVERTGVGAKPLLPQSDAGEGGPVDWSSDGKLVCYSREGRLWLQRLDGSHQPEPFLDPQFGELDAKFSPDAKWVAYPSNRTGRFEVYLRALDRSQGGDRQISLEGGSAPQWRRDGAELFYRGPDGWIMAVDVNQTGVPGQPKRLFQSCVRSELTQWWNSAYYDVTSDGRRFLFHCPAVDEARVKVHVVVNWQGLLKRPGQTLASR
jgi:Tol biopolymer transport system component